MEILTKKKKDSPEEDISEGFEEEAAGIESLKTPWSCLDVFRSRPVIQSPGTPALDLDTLSSDEEDIKLGLSCAKLSTTYASYPLA